MLALTPAASLAAHTPLPPSAEGGGGGSFAGRMVEDIPLPPQEYSCIPRTRRYKKSRWRKPSAFLVSSSPSPTPHVRGGSVSRRGLNQLAGNHSYLSGGTNSEESSQPKRQPLFGREGSGGRGASLREAASPPRNSAIPPPASLRKGVRGRTLLYREVFSPANHYFFSSPCFRAAPTKSRKRGWGRLGRLFSSGWN